MKRDNRDAVLDPFCWVVLDQIWAEIFLAAYKGLGDGTRPGHSALATGARIGGLHFPLE